MSDQPNVKKNEKELTEDQLEQAAGGASGNRMEQLNDLSQIEKNDINRAMERDEKVSQG